MMTSSPLVQHMLSTMSNYNQPRVLFTNRLPPQLNNLAMYLHPVFWRAKATYLGVTLDRRLNFNHHLNQTISKAKTTVSQLIPFLGKHSAMSITNKLKLYTTIIRPQITYAWVFTLLSSKERRLQTTQNKILRLCTSVSWYVTNRSIRKDINVPSLTAHISQLTSTYFEKCAQRPHPEVSHSIQYDASFPWTYRRTRNTKAINQI